MATRTLINGSELEISKRIHNSSWYKLPWWDHNGYPKYSGALSTYTAKHIPIAVSDGETDYYIFSDNTSGNLEIFIADNKGNKTLVRTIEGVTDPHDNGVVNIIDGFIYVVCAARANKRIGHCYRSLNKNDISEFELIDQGYWAYPQLWPNAMLFTRYTPDNIREIYSRVNWAEIKLVSGGHYSISSYDGEWLHLAYNWHEDDDLDKRTNVYYMKSRDGYTWFNRWDEKINLPLSPDDSKTLIHNVSGYVYMKDIEVIDGEVKILAVVSDSFYPDEGQRFLHCFGVNSSFMICEVGHNYNSGGFVDGYILTPTIGESGYCAGDLEVFDLDGTHQLKCNFSYKYNYVRKVVNGNGAYVSEAPTSIVNQGAFIRRVSIK